MQRLAPLLACTTALGGPAPRSPEDISLRSIVGCGSSAGRRRRGRGAAALLLALVVASGCDEPKPSTGTVATSAQAPAPSASATTATPAPPASSGTEAPDPQWVRVSEKFKLVAAPITKEDPDGQEACVVGAATAAQGLPPALVFSDCAGGPPGCKELVPFAAAELISATLDVDSPGGPVLALVLSKFHEEIIELARLDGTLTNSLIVALGHSGAPCSSSVELGAGRYFLGVQGAAYEMRGDPPEKFEVPVSFHVQGSATAVDRPTLGGGAPSREPAYRISDDKRKLLRGSAVAVEASDGARIRWVTASSRDVVWSEGGDDGKGNAVGRGCALFRASPAAELEPKTLGKTPCEGGGTILGAYLAEGRELARIADGRRFSPTFPGCSGSTCVVRYVGIVGDEVFVSLGRPRRVAGQVRNDHVYHLVRLPLSALGAGSPAVEVDWTRSGGGAADGGAEAGAADAAAADSPSADGGGADAAEARP